MQLMQPNPPGDPGQITEQAAQQTIQPLQILANNIVENLPGIIAAMVLFLIGIVLAIIARHLVQRALQRRKSNPQVTILLGRITYWTVLIMMLVVALEQVNFDLTAFLTGLGIVGFTIGFALQDVSKNFVSGLLLLVNQPFRVGDSIKVNDYAGTVIAIDLRATEMHTWDGQVVLIPNGDVFTSVITNYTRATRRRMEIGIGVHPESDLENVRRLTLNTIASLPGVMEDPPPWIYYQEFGESAINFTVYFWVDIKASDMFAVKDNAIVALKQIFEKEEIDLPYPTSVVYNLPGNGASPDHEKQPGQFESDRLK